MANPFDWTAIGSGDVFQSLVSALILFEEPTARSFIQPGRDGAQDARSANGQRIWQAKYHQIPTISKAIRDALAELNKIAAYRAPANPLFETWKHAVEWILVTNTPMNAAAYKRWEEEVVPKFKAIGLDAKLWPKEKLESFLTKYPHVSAAYFKGQGRCFLSLQEAINQAQGDAISATGLQIRLEGREAETDRVREFFLGSKKLLCIHGPGGIGKSRFLLETGLTAANQGLEVLWGQEATLSSTADWFSATPERPTLLLLDEPKDPRLLDIIREQIGSAGRMRSWKVLVSVRSPKDPVLKAVQAMNDSVRDDFVELKPLSKDDAKTVAKHLIETSTLRDLASDQKEQAASVLSSVGSQYPVWIVMAVRALEKDRNLRNLPVTANDIARKYVDEVIEYFPPRLATQEQIHTAIRWLAMYGELNAEETLPLTFIADQAGLSDESRLHECLNSLVQRRFVVRRGVGGRLYSIRPDVVREFIIRDWLIQRADSGIEATPSAKRVIQLLLHGDGDRPVPNVDRLLRSLALLEMSERLQGHDLDILSPLVVELKETIIRGNVREQQVVIQLLHNIAFARVKDVLEAVDVIALNPKDPIEIKSPLFGSVRLTHGEILAELPWLVFEAARYAATKEERVAVLGRMKDLLRRESQTAARNWNDGKRARDLITRIISTERDFRTSFWEDAFDAAKGLVGKVKTGGATDEDLALMRAFVMPFMGLEREQIDFKKNLFTVRRWFVPIDSPSGERRAELRNLLRALIEDRSVAWNVRQTAWSLLDDAHSAVNRIVIAENRPEMEKFVGDIRRDLQDDLSWVLRILQERGLGIAELKVARAIWDWHHRFEKEASLKQIADKCEEVYQKHPLTATFHIFFRHETYKEAQTKAIELGDKYGRHGTDAEIFQFLREAEEFAAADSDWSNIGIVADRIGNSWTVNPQIETFVRSALRSDPKAHPFWFAARVLNAELRRLRNDPDDSHLKTILDAWLEIPADSAARDQLLLHLYSRPHPLITGLLRVPDFDALSSAFGFSEAAITSRLDDNIKLSLLTGVSHLNWPRFQTAAEGIWNKLETTKRVEALSALINGLTFLDLFKIDYESLRLDRQQFDWLLDLFLTLDDLEGLNDHAEWELFELSNRFGKKPVQWFLTAISKRLTLASEIGELFKAIPSQNILIRFVSPIQESEQSKETIDALAQLIRYTHHRDMLGYKAPEYAAAIDPTGAVVPDLVVAELKSLNNPSKEQVLDWARFAGHYPFNSESWRKIATETLIASEKFTSRDKVSVYVVLLEQGIRSSNYNAGEMDPQFQNELDQRRRERADEQDPKLIPFRDWHVRVAESEYDRALAEFREAEDE